MSLVSSATTSAGALSRRCQKPAVFSERAPARICRYINTAHRPLLFRISLRGAYLVAGACCVGFKWHFSVKMARWSTPRVPFRGTRGVFWGAREVARKPKRTVLKLRARTWALRVPRIHLHAASHAKHSPLFSPEKGHFLAFTPGPLTAIFGR